jgi:antitoxin PrlF
MTNCKGWIMAESTITSKGQTTVPAKVREALHAEPGTRLEWHVAPGCNVIVRAKTLSIRDLAGSLVPNVHVESDDMKAWRS